MGHPDLLQYPANDEDKRVRPTEKSANALRTISEAAELIDVPQHVLRFWETKFSQIKPLKRNGGRRFYRPADIEILQQIKFLLYKQGYTIKGAKKAIDDLASKQQDGSVKDWAAAFPPANSNDNTQSETPVATLAGPVKVRDKAKLASLKDELMSLRQELAPFIERSTAA